MRRLTIKNGLLLFLLLGIGFPLGAQETWNLNECIDYALQNNLDQYDLKLGEEAAKIDQLQSKLNLLPSVSASSSAGLNFGRSVDPSTNDIVNTELFNNSNSLNSSLTLFRGFIQQNQIAYSRFRREAAQWETINNQDDLAFKILMAYYDVTYYNGLIEIAKEQLRLSEINLKKTEALIETGLKARTDLAEIQATYEKEKLNLIQSENKKQEARLRLGQLMNLPAGELTQMQIEAEEPELVSSMLLANDSLFASFVTQSPFVKMAEARLQASAKEAAVVRGQFFPTVQLNASISTGYYETYRDDNGKTIAFKTQLDNNMSQYVGASISIPVFAKNQIRSQYRKAKLAEEQAQIQVDRYRQTVYYELLNNSRELQALFREFVQTGKQVEADDLAFQVAQRKYDEGLIDVIELLAVKNRLGEAQSNRLLASLQWAIKARVVDFYKGVRFWEE
ncbi:TolC family protein [Sunxiuqinia elliptica]|uniref:Outer membrane protein n=1 Tax=Sunxiuqinia elliptica TaxID=655355 RepID=A0A4R6H4D7_9BACT|nr:TolC family protein [Sunxiuqinia elliptica]TDO02707.1 outer membrane protein [Sunxiuqinia elliptica]TDO58555.1 outer membrane protein [Sunxiuqinia elliptica]